MLIEELRQLAEQVDHQDYKLDDLENRMQYLEDRLNSYKLNLTLAVLATITMAMAIFTLAVLGVFK